MSNAQGASFHITDEDIFQATKAALGSKAIVESSNTVLIEEPGVGFLAIHFLITVRARASPGQPVVEVPMFAKMQPPVEGAPSLFRAFAIEGGFLKKLQGPLNEALKSADGHEGPTWSPKCYLAKEDLLIFENISVLGYKTSEEPILTIEHFRCVCRAFARLHAAGVLLVNKIGEEALIEMCPELMENILFSNDYKTAGVYVRNASADALAVLLNFVLTPTEMPRLKELQVRVINTIAHIKRPKSEIEPMFNKMTLAVGYTEEKLHSLNRGLWDDLKKAKVGPLVPLHGDAHSYNFMFKNDEHDKPIDAVLIDFQLARLHVPALDLLFCLNFSATPEFVETYSDELLQHYYKCLEEEFTRCGSKIEKIFPYKDFLAGAELVRIPALYTALMYTTVMQAPKMELGKIMVDPFDYRRYLLGCRSAETLRWFNSEPNYRSKIEKMLRKLLEL